MAAEAPAVRYKPPGPVAAAFLASDAPVRAIMGPIGSGKTSACLMAILNHAIRQTPSPIDGVRYFRAAVIRATFRDLERTTIASWHQWFPKTMGEWSGGTGGTPARHWIRFTMPSVGMLDLEVIFIGIGEHKIEDVMRGLEVTMFYLNEADTLSQDVLTYAIGRAGRYPQKIHGAPRWAGVIADFNAPDEENWCTQRFDYNRPPEWGFFRQPSGLSPQAENMANLPDGYYERTCQGAEEWYIRRFVRNEYGYSRDGLPVFPEWNDTLHTARTKLDPDPARPLVIGLDAGLTPAAWFQQQTALGQWRIIDELSPGHCGPTRFADLLNQLLATRYAGFKRQQIIAAPDPASFAGGEGDDPAWAQIVAARTKLAQRRPHTNAIGPRLEAVRITLTRMIDGRYPGLVLSPHCTTIRRAFNSGYRFRRKRLPGEARFEEAPEKNDWSHVMDAGQYAMLVGGEYAAVMGRAKDQAQHSGQIYTDSEETPGGVYDHASGGAAYAEW